MGDIITGAPLPRRPGLRAGCESGPDDRLRAGRRETPGLGPSRRVVSSRASTAIAAAAAEPHSMAATQVVCRSVPARRECRNAAGQAR